MSDDAAALERHLAGGQAHSLLAAAAGPAGITPLHVCALLDAPACAAVLLAAGAEADAATAKSYWSTSVQERGAWPLDGKLGRKLRRSGWRLYAGITPLSLAAQLGSEATAAVLLDAGADVWRVAAGCSASVVRLIAQRAAAGTLQLAGAEQLGPLLRCAAACAPAACLELLQVPQLAGAVLRPADLDNMLESACGFGHAGLVRHLLELGANHGGGEGLTNVWRAVDIGACKVVELLLDAGAPLNENAVKSALWRPAMLELLLRRGPLPVDHGAQRFPVNSHEAYDWYSWSCPVLQLLFLNKVGWGPPPMPGLARSAGGLPHSRMRAGALAPLSALATPLDCNAHTTCLRLDRRPPCARSAQKYHSRKWSPFFKRPRDTLRTAELLAGAGYRPTVYRNVVPAPDSERVAEFDPLVELAERFELEGVNK